MRISTSRHRTLLAGFLLAAIFTVPAIASAQGFGIGARMAWVKANTDGVDIDAVRFTGGQVRMTGGRLGLEVSMDRHSESFELLNQKITETPIQASLLLRLGRGKVAPFLLGGPGWYKRKVELIEGSDADIVSTEFGWHAGAGLEVHPGRHFGIHGDYRFTFLKFGNDDDDGGDGGFLGGILPSLPGLPEHRGSQWTLGFTVYF